MCARSSERRCGGSGTRVRGHAGSHDWIALSCYTHTCAAPLCVNVWHSQALQCGEPLGGVLRGVRLGGQRTRHMPQEIGPRQDGDWPGGALGASHARGVVPFRPRGRRPRDLTALRLGGSRGPRTVADPSVRVENTCQLGTAWNIEAIARHPPSIVWVVSSLGPSPRPPPPPPRQHFALVSVRGLSRSPPHTIPRSW